MSAWPEASSGGWCLTKGQPDWSGITLGHKMSLAGGMSDQRSTWTEASPGKYIWPQVNLTEVVSHLARRCLCLGGTSEQRSAWPKVWPNVSLNQSLIWEAHLIRGLPGQHSIMLGWEMSLPGGTSDQRSAWPKDLKKCQPAQSLTYGGVHLTKCIKFIWKFEHTLHFRCCFAEVFSTKDQQECYLKAFVTTADSIEKVQDSCPRSAQSCEDSDHIMYACTVRVNGGDVSGYVDVGKHGRGAKLRSALKQKILTNMSVFVAWVCGGVLLGEKSIQINSTKWLKKQSIHMLKTHKTQECT